MVTVYVQVCIGISIAGVMRVRITRVHAWSENYQIVVDCYD